MLGLFGLGWGGRMLKEGDDGKVVVIAGDGIWNGKKCCAGDGYRI